jgi:hypothetical protein
VDKMAIDEKYIGTIIDFSDNVGVPYFVEKGLFTHYF